MGRISLIFALLVIGVLNVPHTTSLAHQVTFGPLAELGPTLSPDGRWIAFESFSPADKGAIELWVMPTEGPYSSARPLVKDGRYHAGISWSPDSNWIAYVTSEKISFGSSLSTFQIDKINVHTNETLRLTHLPEGTAIGDNTSWSRDGLIAFELNDGLYAIKESSGRPFPLVSMAYSGKELSLSPLAPISWSPDAKRIAFLTAGEADTEKVTLWIGNPATMKVEPVLERKRLCCMSWPLRDKFLLSIPSDDGSERICLFSLDDHRFQQLTKGPMDLAGALLPAQGKLYFNHSPTRNVEFSDSLVMKLHVWVTHIPNID